VRVLVLGGTGFLGPPAVAELLGRGHEVAVFHRGVSGAGGADGAARLPAGVAEIFGDRKRLGESAAAIRRFAPDVAVDLILSSGAQARELMDVLRGVARRVVVASSLDVYRATGVLYGTEPGGLEPLPLTESSPLRTRLQTYPPAQIAMLQQTFGWLADDYDKIPVEREILGDPELAGTVLRLPMVYGPGDKLHRFHPVVRRIADRRPAIPIGETMAGWRASKAYVDNVADAIVLGATDERAAGRVYTVAEPDALTEVEWTRLAARAAGWDGQVVVLPADLTPEHLRAPGNAEQHWVADSSRIRGELGWGERVPREEGVRRGVEWERANLPAPEGANPYRFDYEAEDAALAALAGRG
jgi:nucleoside-diphosphate-sugar epimerase